MPSLIRSALLEGFASMIIVWFFGLLLNSLSAAQSHTYNNLFLAITVAIFVSLILFVIVPLTGGHLSPMITLTMAVAGLTSPIKALAYIGGQLTGATLAGLLVALSLGTRASEIENYGCYFNLSSNWSAVHASTFEFMTTICGIAMMYGLNTTSRTYGPQFSKRISPLLNGITIGLFVFASSAFSPVGSYAGTLGFPNRCWATSVAVLKFEPNDWVFWIPGMMAAIIHGLAYRYLDLFGEEKLASINTSEISLPTRTCDLTELPKSDVIIQINNIPLKDSKKIEAPLPSYN